MVEVKPFAACCVTTKIALLIRLLYDENCMYEIISLDLSCFEQLALAHFQYDTGGWLYTTIPC